jgi:hypothetical protein
MHPIQDALLLLLAIIMLVLFTRLLLFIAPLFRRLQLNKFRCTPDTPHLHSLSWADSVCLVPFSLAANRGITILFSFPTGTKMFQFPEFAFSPRCHDENFLRSYFAFGDREIKACMQLPRAYRSLPRPSSQPKPSHPSHSLNRPFKINLEMVP